MAAKPAPLAAALVVGVALGGGAVKVSTESYETSARVSRVIFLPEGDKVAVQLETKIGDCRSEREVVARVDGSDAKLNGHHVDDDAVRAIAAIVPTLQAAAAKVDKGIADRVVGARFLSDGKIAALLEKQVDGQAVGVEVIYERDGSAAKAHGVPVAGVDELGSALAIARADAEKIDAEAMVKPLPKEPRLPDLLGRDLDLPPNPPPGVR